MPGCLCEPNKLLYCGRWDGPGEPDNRRVDGVENPKLFEYVTVVLVREQLVYFIENDDIEALLVAQAAEVPKIP